MFYYYYYCYACKYLLAIITFGNLSENSSIVSSSCLALNEKNQNYKNQTNGLTNNFTNINCVSTSNFMVMKLFKNWPSYEQTTSCLGCSTVDTRYSTTLMANLPINTLDFLQDVINQLLEPQ